MKLVGYGHIPAPQQRVIDLWDAGRSYAEIASELGVRVEFVRETVCRLDDRNDIEPEHEIRKGTMLLAARIRQCFPHLPDKRRVA